MSLKIGILGVGGYGGGEVLRLCASHPNFDVTYVSGSQTIGKKLIERFPGVASKLADLVIEDWDIAKMATLDLIFASLPTGNSKGAFDQLPSTVKIVDIGGDNRYAPGWVYGLADVWPDKIKNANRVANPGCFPSASLIAIAPLLDAGLVNLSSPIIIDAKSGISGAGRGGADNKFGFSEVNEDVTAYRLHSHGHVPEMAATISALTRKPPQVCFTPHLIPMTRGILATCYLTSSANTEQCFAAARKFYANRPFVRIVDAPPHTKWATGSNLAFISYAAAEGAPLIALGAIDNLGKGAAGQAVQNANLMLGLAETMGLEGSQLWP